MNTDLIRRRIRQSIAVQELLVEDSAYLDAVSNAGHAICSALKNGRRVFFFGNGGSAADAQHLAAELIGRYLKERASLAAVSLTTNTSTLTAIANDFSYDLIFARQLEGLASPGDVAVGLTTSGRSRNVIRALEAARKMKMVTIGLTGQQGGPLRNAVDYCLCVPCTDVPRIQEAHMLTGHIICEIVENEAAASGFLATP